MWSRMKKNACGCFKPPVRGNGGNDGDDNRRRYGGEGPSTGKQPMEIDEFEEHPLLWSRALDDHILGQFSFAVLQANKPLEDASQVEVSNRGTFVGIYDGHGGTEASFYVLNHLFDHFINLLQANHRSMSEEVIRQAIAATEEGFFNVVTRSYERDHDNAAKGSCCLVGVIWGGTLYIANLGDSRAVMGCKRSNGMVAEQLNEEHNACHEAIRNELRKRHPNDPRILDDSRGVWRIKNLIQISRSIGDFYLKNPAYPAATDRYRPNTPITEAVLRSDPAIYTRRLDRTDQFVIFASDGLWDQLSNEEAVHIVVKHSREGIAKKLVQLALARAAIKSIKTYREVQELPIEARRRVHDDISVVVLFLDELVEDAKNVITKVSVRPFMNSRQSRFTALDDDGAGPSGTSGKDDDGAGPSGTSGKDDDEAGPSGTSGKDDDEAGPSGSSATDALPESQPGPADSAGASGSSAKDAPPEPQQM